MICEIIKIHLPQKSRNGNTYLRVEFKMEGGGWLKTDLCYDFRNWSRWKKILKIGNLIGNLILKDATTIDADSRPIKLNRKEDAAPDLNDPKVFSKRCLQ